MKRFCALLFCITILLCTASCNGSANVPSKQQSTVENALPLSVYCFNTGKSDAFLVSSDNMHMLIDTADSDDSSVISGYLRLNDIEKLDYLVLTHYDKDHIGSAAKIIKNFEIGQIVACPNISSGSDEYKKYKNAADKKGINPTLPESQLNFTFGDATVNVFPPNNAAYDRKPENNSSLAVKITHHNIRFLFTGDAEDDRITELMQLEDIKADFLKMPYHGNYESSYDEFLSKVKPLSTVITSSEDMPEDERTLKAIENVGSAVYLTRKGAVTAISDGNRLDVTQQ